MALNYIATYVDTQIVQQSEIEADAAQAGILPNRIYSPQGLPFIVEGLLPTISVGGLVTVTDGHYVGPIFTQGQFTALPLEGSTPLIEIDTPPSVDVLATGGEWALIVLRQTLDPVAGTIEGPVAADVGFNVVSTLVSITGVVGGYPAVGVHDTVIVGVKTAGATTYELDFSQRARDTDTYNQTTLQNPLFTDNDFFNWNRVDSTALVVTAGSTELITPSWSVESVALDTTVTQMDTVAADRLALPGSPSTYLNVTQLATQVLAEQVYSQQLLSLSSVANRWVTFSFWHKLSSAGAVSYILKLVNNPSTLLFETSAVALPVTTDWVLTTQTVFIPIDVSSIVDPSEPFTLSLHTLAPDGAFDLDISTVNANLGRYYTVPQPPLASKGKIDKLNFYAPVAMAILEGVQTGTVGNASQSFGFSGIAISNPTDEIIELTFSKPFNSIDDYTVVVTSRNDAGAAVGFFSRTASTNSLIQVYGFDAEAGAGTFGLPAQGLSVFVYRVPPDGALIA